MKKQITHNEKLNGIEVRFDEVPPEDVREWLKVHGFRWSKRQGMWYGYFSEELMGQVESYFTTVREQQPVEPEQAEPAKSKPATKEPMGLEVDETQDESGNTGFAVFHAVSGSGVSSLFPTREVAERFMAMIYPFADWTLDAVALVEKHPNLQSQVAELSAKAVIEPPKVETINPTIPEPKVEHQPVPTNVTPITKNLSAVEGARRYLASIGVIL